MQKFTEDSYGVDRDFGLDTYRLDERLKAAMIELGIMATNSTVEVD